MSGDQACDRVPTEQKEVDEGRSPGGNDEKAENEDESYMRGRIRIYIHMHMKDPKWSSLPLVFFGLRDLDDGLSVLEAQGICVDNIHRDDSIVLCCRHFPYDNTEGDFRDCDGVRLCRPGEHDDNGSYDTWCRTYENTFDRGEHVKNCYEDCCCYSRFDDRFTVTVADVKQHGDVAASHRKWRIGIYVRAHMEDLKWRHFPLVFFGQCDLDDGLEVLRAQGIYIDESDICHDDCVVLCCRHFPYNDADGNFRQCEGVRLCKPEEHGERKKYDMFCRTYSNTYGRGDRVWWDCGTYDCCCYSEFRDRFVVTTTRAD